MMFKKLIDSELHTYAQGIHTTLPRFVHINITKILKGNPLITSLAELKLFKFGSDKLCMESGQRTITLFAHLKKNINTGHGGHPPRKMKKKLCPETVPSFTASKSSSTPELFNTQMVHQIVYK